MAEAAGGPWGYWYYPFSVVLDPPALVHIRGFDAA
jgi:hypothetical protein